jgi:nitrogen fixation-related uncharacterized protein
MFLTVVLAVAVVAMAWLAVWLWWGWHQEQRQYDELNDLYAALVIDHAALRKSHNEAAAVVAFADPWPEWDPSRVESSDPS